MKHRLLSIPILFSGGGPVPVYKTIPQYQTTSNTVVDDFEDYTSWTKVSGVDPVDDAVNFTQGSHSVRLTNAGAQSVMDKALSFTMTTGERLTMDILIHSGATKRFSILCSNNAGFTKYMYCTVRLDGMPWLPGMWYHLDLGAGDFTMDGGMTWTTAITKVRIRSEGADTDASFDNFCREVNTFSPALLLTWDNAYGGFYSNAVPVFDARHLRSTMYVSTDELNTAGKMTTAQMMALYNAGWTIGNHTDDHVNFTSLSVAQIQTSVGNCIADLQAAGVGGNQPYQFCYPGGIYNANSATALPTQNILTARTTGGNTTYLGLIGYNDPPLYLTGKNLDNTYSLAQAKALLDSAVLKNKVCSLYGHDIQAAAASLTWATADLAALLDYAISLNVPVITVEDYWNLYSGPVTVRMS
jgi:peptidoglycan/xylan/chitin deacetylase (PgdA/CDA1 family)